MFKGIDFSKDITANPNPAMQYAILKADADTQQEIKTQTARVIRTNIEILANLLKITCKEIKVLNESPTINTLLFEWLRDEDDMSAEEFHVKCISNGVRFLHMAPTLFQAIVHADISPTDVLQAVDIVRMVCHDPILETS